MIDKFDGDNAFLSNFYSSPITYDNICYPTVEHYFQAQKTLDKNKRKEIAAAMTPGVAKRLGRHVKLRPDWEEVKDDVMYRGLFLKFSQEPLRQWLLETGDKFLKEGNTWHDNYWGVCSCEKCQQHVGRNHLGLLLMRVRTELKKGC